MAGSGLAGLAWRLPQWPEPSVPLLQNLESQLKAHLSLPLPGTGGPPTRRFQTCLTTKEVFTQHRGAYPGLTYHRIPLPDFCAPCEQVRALCGLGLWGARGGPLPPPPLAWASAVGAAPPRDWELVP